MARYVRPAARKSLRANCLTEVRQLRRIPSRTLSRAEEASFGFSACPRSGTGSLRLRVLSSLAVIRDLNYWRVMSLQVTRYDMRSCSSRDSSPTRYNSIFFCFPYDVAYPFRVVISQFIFGTNFVFLFYLYFLGNTFYMLIKETRKNNDLPKRSCQVR